MAIDRQFVKCFEDRPLRRGHSERPAPGQSRGIAVFVFRQTERRVIEQGQGAAYERCVEGEARQPGWCVAAVDPHGRMRAQREIVAVTLEVKGGHAADMDLITHDFLER